MRTEQVEERARAAEAELRKTVQATPASKNATDALTLLHGAFDKRRRAQEMRALAACETNIAPEK
jgi:hypothetical protein